MNTPACDPDFAQHAMPGVAGLTPYAPGKPISELKRELGLDNIIKLASNENPMGPSPKALLAARAAMADVHRYPDGNGYALKEALAKKHDVPTRAITLGNGSNDVLDLVARAFLGPGRNAVFSAHAFAVYPIATRAVGAEAQVVPALGRDHAMCYGHDLAAMVKAVDEQTAVVFIANPNNPTGTWVNKDALLQTLENIPSHVIVVVDEAYIEYVQHPDYPDASQWLDRFANLVVTRTFSKAYGLAGLRIGYALSHPQVADLLNRVRQPFNVNLAAQEAALSALSDQQHLHDGVRLNNEQLARMQVELEQRRLFYIPSVGNFISFQTAHDTAAVYRALLQEGIIIRPVDNYALPRFLRVTVGMAKDNDRFLKALDDVLQRLEAQA